MPENDNIPLEKVDIEINDFGGNLNNDFGIEDTQILATKDLEKFLFSDPDDVKTAEEVEKKEAAKKLAEKEASEKEKEKEKGKSKTKSPEEVKAEGAKRLENQLFGEGDEEEETSEEDDDKTKTQKQGGNSDDDPYTTLARDLMKLGVFTKNTEDESEETLEVKTPEEFLDRWNLEKKKGAVTILDNFLGQFGEEYRNMFDTVFVKGVKPTEYLEAFAKIETVKGLDMTQESNQQKVVREYYKSLKWDDTKIENKLQKLKDYGDLEDESKTYHELLLARETEKVAALEQAKVDKQEQEKVKTQTTNQSYQRILKEKLKTQEIGGIPLTQEDAEKVFAYLANQPYKLESGEKLSEFDKFILELNRPENHEYKIMMGLLAMKKMDLTSIKKTALSKKSDALFTLSTKNAKKQDEQKKEMKSFF